MCRRSLVQQALKSESRRNPRKCSLTTHKICKHRSHHLIRNAWDYHRPISFVMEQRYTLHVRSVRVLVLLGHSICEHVECVVLCMRETESKAKQFEKAPPVSLAAILDLVSGGEMNLSLACSFDDKYF